MIPILYDTNETNFTSNGLGRLRDVIECTVVEERNGIYECDFSYPVGGANYDLIQVGRIIGVTHDESGDIEPFDIVSYSKPIDGVVEFHCTHISYRLSYMTVTGSNINSLADAFSLFRTAQPNMPFDFQTDKTNTGYLACADGTPRSVRQMMGGIEGSILDAYGGEYSFNNWSVYLHESRGEQRDFQIRYGVNMLDYNEDYDIQGAYMSCIPYWSNNDVKVVGDKVNGAESTITNRDECVPLDLSDKFQDQPTKAQVEAMAYTLMNTNNKHLPSQTIHVEFARLQDLGFENLQGLLQCNLCDTIRVIFPDYGTSGQFKIVKTEWDVLRNRYASMELGDLSVSLSQALGISNGTEKQSGSTEPDDYVVEEGTVTGGWYRKWQSGKAECWCHRSNASGLTTANWVSPVAYMDSTSFSSIWNGVFNATPDTVVCTSNDSQTISVYPYTITSTGISRLRFLTLGAKSNIAYAFSVYAVGTWR